MNFNFSLSSPDPKTLSESRKIIEALWSQCQSDQKTLSDLKEKLKTNSTNSSQSPSSDSIRARAERFKERNAWKKRTPSYWKNPRQGAQKGHQGHGRKLWDLSLINEVVGCHPEQISPCCSAALRRCQLRQRKQVFDIKEGRLHVTEYQVYGGKCSVCKKVIRGKLPDGVPSGILGSEALGRVGALTGKYRLSKREARELMIDFYNLHLSVGTISNAEKSISDAVASPVDEVGEAIRLEKVVNSDETSHFNKGALEWLWVMTTTSLTYFKIFEHRNTEAAQAFIGKEFSGTLITDRYGSYNWMPRKKHQYCWEHLKRDFKKVMVREEPKERTIGYNLFGIYRLIFHYWRKIEEGLDFYKKRLLKMIRLFRDVLRSGSALEGTKTGRFCAKLLREWDCLWHFLRDELVEATNNHAERQLRHGVLWRKKSFGTQSDRGRKYVERILTCVMTCKQQKRNLVTFLSDCVKGHWKVGSYPSLILPSEPRA